MRLTSEPLSRDANDRDTTAVREEAIEPDGPRALRGARSAQFLRPDDYADSVAALSVRRVAPLRSTLRASIVYFPKLTSTRWDQA